MKEEKILNDIVKKWKDLNISFIEVVNGEVFTTTPYPIGRSASQAIQDYFDRND